MSTTEPDWERIARTLAAIVRRDHIALGDVNCSVEEVLRDADMTTAAAVIAQVKQLSLRADDVVVVSLRGADWDQWQPVVDMLAAALPEGVRAVVLPWSVTVSKATEAERLLLALHTQITSGLVLDCYPSQVDRARAYLTARGLLSAAPATPTDRDEATRLELEWINDNCGVSLWTYLAMSDDEWRAFHRGGALPDGWRARRKGRDLLPVVNISEPIRSSCKACVMGKGEHREGCDKNKTTEET